jgi:transposase
MLISRLKLNVEETGSRKRILPLVMTIANKFLKKIRLVETIDGNVSWDPYRWKTSPGNLIKVFIISTLTDIRIPLTHLEERLSGIDVGYFLEGANQDGNVNEYNVGEALERIGKEDSDGMFEKIALGAVQEYNLPMNRQHGDTSTLSFYGSYDEDTMKLDEEEKEELLKLERGYNKDGRRGCIQLVIGNVTNELGIPVSIRTMDGSTSDVDWNKEGIEFMGRLSKEGYNGIYVADCKVVTNERVSEMNAPESRVNFVSLCPANFEEKLASQAKEQAYSKDDWEDIGAVSGTKDATKYKGTSIIENVCGAPTRLLVLESDTLALRAEKSFDKKQQEVNIGVKKIESGTWYCNEDAKKALTEFEKLKSLQLFEYEASIEKQTTEKWPRGRRGPETKPKYIESYQIKIKNLTILDEARQKFIRDKSCLVLISNVMDCSNVELLRIYKGQHVVENSFRQLKSPQLASVIYLKNPSRIKGLSMVLHVALLVRALIQFRLREGLREHIEKRPNEVIRAGWGGRPLETPTFQLLYEHAINCYFEHESCGEYSFSWPSRKTKNLVAPLLALLNLTLSDLLNPIEPHFLNRTGDFATCRM